MTNDSNFFQANLFGWTYVYANGKFHIIPDVEYEIPQTLYKYYALTPNSVDALMNTYIYATHPNQLNDRLDCYEQLIDFDTPDTIREFFGEYETIVDFLNLPDEQLFTKENRKHFQHMFKILVYQKFGVLSMSEGFDNMLMWAHYAQNSGFCLELDYTQFPFNYSGPFPVNYQESFSPIKLSKTPLESAIAAQSNVKNKIWEYEKEWRVIIHAPEKFIMKTFGYWHGANQFANHNRKFYYPVTAIKSIILGFSFFSWGELSSESGKSLWNVNLDSKNKNYYLKKEILDFIIDNDIVVGIIQPKNMNKFTPIPIHMHRVTDSPQSYVLCELNWNNYKRNLKPQIK